MSLKNIFFVLLTLVLFPKCKNKEFEKEEPVKPNIIYVLADDLGYGDIKAFNKDGKINTPNLDKLAAEGLIFTDAHTTSSVCTPSRYSILTGRYSWRTKLKSGVLTGKSKALIPNSRTTVASLLKTQGYHTAFIGKWHLGWDWALKDENNFGGKGWNFEDFNNIDFTKPIKNGPNNIGFDYTYGHCGSLDMGPYVFVENNNVTELPLRTTENTNDYGFWRKAPTATHFKHEDVTPHFFNKAIAHISHKSKNKDPFFLYLALPSPHTPILPSKVWQGKSGLNPYGDFIIMIDNYIGQLVETIRLAGIEDNTLIIFTSDNGCAPSANFEALLSKGHSPSHIYRGMKADIFEGGHRVPFIAKWPKIIKPNSVSSQTISTADFLTICADITGYALKDNEGEDSYSLMSIFKDENINKPIREATVHHSVNGSFAIRKNAWKLIMCPGSGGWSFPKPDDKVAFERLPKSQLYNLKTDPTENVNLIMTNTEKASELKALLQQYIINGRSTPGKKQLNDDYEGYWHQIEFIEEIK